MIFEVVLIEVCKVCEFVLVVFVFVVENVVIVVDLVVVLVKGGLFVFEVILCIEVVLDVICEML